MSSLKTMPFTHESVRHDLVLRRGTVSAVREIVPSIVRVTLTGPELTGFRALGPADHVKVFLPDPASGQLLLPDADAQGLRRPGATGTIISRDYTPLEFRADSGELDLDFVLHGDDGPASAWASRATPGDQLGIAGPRGSRLAPAEVAGMIIVADETALPATRRWLGMLPEHVPVTGLFDVADEGVADYFADDPELSARLDAEWLSREDGPGQLDEALRSLGPIADDVFVFLAGEASTLAPLRRYLRRELGLPADQVSASGYWKRGIVNFDHHAPVDPTDPD
jgi:NADPH-dependent ferric siderophore reductase